MGLVSFEPGPRGCSETRLAASCGSWRPRRTGEEEEVGIGRTDPPRTVGTGASLLETEVR